MPETWNGARQEASKPTAARQARKCLSDTVKSDIEEREGGLIKTHLQQRRDGEERGEVGRAQQELRKTQT
jgi:hypothetical protein